MKQADILQFQMLSGELEKIQQYLTEIEKRSTAVASLIASLESFNELGPGQEVLFPLADGIFAEGKTMQSESLLINVGQGVVVRRTVPEAVKMIQNQFAELRQQQTFVAQQQEQLYNQLQQLETKVTQELAKEADETSKKRDAKKEE